MCICVCVCVRGGGVTQICLLTAGMCLTAYSIIHRIVFNAYFAVLNKLGLIIRLQNLPFLGLLGQFPPQQRPFSELPMLLYNIYNI